jgi:hypothetical protein
MIRVASIVHRVTSTFTRFLVTCAPMLAVPFTYTGLSPPGVGKEHRRSNASCMQVYNLRLRYDGGSGQPTGLTESTIYFFSFKLMYETEVSFCIARSVRCWCFVSVCWIKEGGGVFSLMCFNRKDRILLSLVLFNLSSPPPYFPPPFPFPFPFPPPLPKRQASFFHYYHSFPMYPSVSSATLLRSAGSKNSLLSGGGGSGGYGDPYGSLSRQKLGTLGKASTPNLHFTTSCSNLDPSHYLVPGVPPGTHIIYAVASARIYHNTQQTTQKGNNHTTTSGSSGSSSVLNFGMRKKKSWGGAKEKDKSQWVYSYLKGTLVFGQDVRAAPSSSSSGLGEEDLVAFERIRVHATGSSSSSTTSSSRDDVGPRGDHWFQLVDDETAKVVWRFKVPPLGAAAGGNASRKFSYEFDRPFFHVFQGSVSVTSFSFFSLVF